MSDDEVDDFLDTVMDTMQNIKNGNSGTNVELSPSEKINVYQGISTLVSGKDVSGENIKKITKALKEVPEQAILPTVGPPVEMSPLDMAQMQMDNTDFSSTMTLGNRTVSIPPGPGTKQLIIAVALLAGGIALIKAVQQSDNGDGSDATPATSETEPPVDAPDVSIPRNLKDLPSTARTTEENSEAQKKIFKSLEENNGIDPNLASKRLHEIKQENGFKGENVVLDWTGNVYNPYTGDLIGSLTQGGAK